MFTLNQQIESQIGFTDCQLKTIYTFVIQSRNLSHSITFSDQTEPSRKLMVRQTQTCIVGQKAKSHGMWKKDTYLVQTNHLMCKQWQNKKKEHWSILLVGLIFKHPSQERGWWRREGEGGWWRNNAPNTAAPHFRPFCGAVESIGLITEYRRPAGGADAPTPFKHFFSMQNMRRSSQQQRSRRDWIWTNCDFHRIVRTTTKTCVIYHPE